MRMCSRVSIVGEAQHTHCDTNGMPLRCTFWSISSALCNTLHMKALVRCGVNRFHTYLSHPTLGEATRLASMYLAMEKDPDGEVDRMSLSSSFGSSSTRLIISFSSSVNTCVKLWRLWIPSLTVHSSSISGFKISPHHFDRQKDISPLPTCKWLIVLNI